MINNSNREQLIQDYIEGNLSVQDTKEFEALLAKDTTLRNEVALQREILENIEEALAIHEIEEIFEEVNADQKAFIQQTAKQTYARHRLNNGWKNLIVVLVLAGGLITGGVMLSKQYRNKNNTVTEKTSSAQVAELPSTVVQNKATKVDKTPDTLKETDEDIVDAQTPNKIINTKPERRKEEKLQSPSPYTLPALTQRLDSLPEIRLNQSMGFGKKSEASSRFRLVYFYNRLPKATEMPKEASYQFQDTLRFYGPVGDPQKLFLLFNPRRGEYSLVTPKDTLPLQYKDSEIFRLRGKN